MIKIYSNPFIADFIQIAAQLPQDERDQIEAMSGQKFEIDGVALGNYSVNGPKWVAKVADTEEEFEQGLARPVMVGGFAFQRPGVWRDFLLTTEEAWTDHWHYLTRVCRRHMTGMLQSGYAHRIECIVPAARIESRPEIEKWYKLLGYNKEGLRFGYCANGADALAYARVKH